MPNVVMRRIEDASKALPSSTAFKNQPDKGQIPNCDFYRDPLNAKKLTKEEKADLVRSCDDCRD